MDDAYDDDPLQSGSQAPAGPGSPQALALASADVDARRWW